MLWTGSCFIHLLTGRTFLLIDLSNVVGFLFGIANIKRIRNEAAQRRAKRPANGFYVLSVTDAIELELACEGTPESIPGLTDNDMVVFVKIHIVPLVFMLLLLYLVSLPSSIVCCKFLGFVR